MDKDFMTQNISLLKELEKNYIIACEEASNEKVFNAFKKGLDKLISMQRDTFNVMNKNNMYEIKNVENKEIKTAYNTISKEFKKIKMPK